MRKLTFCWATVFAAWLIPSNNLIAAAREDPSLRVTKEQETATVNAIYKRIVTAAKEQAEGELKLYTNTIPGSEVKYVMVPIKGGEFTMGSPNSEPGRSADEG